MRIPFRALIVGNLPEQAEIVAHELAKAGFAPAWSIASDLATCRSAIESGVDFVVIDCDQVEVALAAVRAKLCEILDQAPDPHESS